MWFWYMWGISLFVSIVVTGITGMAMAKQIKREYPNYKSKSKSSFIEIVRAYLPLLIPFLNILFVLAMILSYDAIYKKAIDKLKINDINNGEQLREEK